MASNRRLCYPGTGITISRGRARRAKTLTAQERINVGRVRLRAFAPAVLANLLVPLAGIEPALLAELDFESSASTNSATGAFATPAGRRGVVKRAEYSGRGGRVNPLVWKRLSSVFVVPNGVAGTIQAAQNTPL